MRLLIVNPNSTADMTDRIGDEARSHLPDWVELTLKTNESGPPSIQGAADGDTAVPGTLALLSQTPHDAAVIGCFDDTGLAELSLRGAHSVIGLGEAAFRSAASSGLRFAVLTTAELSVPVLEANMHTYGFDTNCVCIHASSIDVLDFERDRENASRRLIASGGRLLKEHPEIQAIVLGCAGMGGLTEEMEKSLGVDVIDPVHASVDLALERAGYLHS